MTSITRAAAAGVLAVGVGLVGVGAAGIAQAEPRYHWCPGEQWSSWMGANWEPNLCHDNHYLDNVPHDPANWRGEGPYDPSFPAPVAPN